MMLGVILGPVVIFLGAKAFSEKGIPLTRQKNLTGTSAKVIGIICIFLGLTMTASGLLSMMHFFPSG